MLHIPKTREVKVRRDGTRVLVIEAGRTILELPWRAADEVAAALRTQARRAEEEEKAMTIAGDNAVLIRAGVPLGLTSRLDILKESLRTALWDRGLRRALPGGIRSREVFGTPTIIRHKPNGRTS